MKMKHWKKLAITVILLVISVIAVPTYLGYRQYQAAINETPLQEKVENIKAQDNYVSYEHISPYLINATIAVEDHRFFDHHGFDALATARALVNNLTGNGMKAGGSTITQQLAKNMYFAYEPSFIRKIAELYVVFHLEHQYSKTEILALYLNIINYGDNHIGINEAANGYFGVEPEELNLAQASMLAGLPQSPANYQLSDHYENAKARQKQVLEAMVKRKMISEEQMQEALAE